MATQMRGSGHSPPRHNLHPIPTFSILPCTQILRPNYSPQHLVDPHAIIRSQLLPRNLAPLQHHLPGLKDHLV
jgi:hypothetical protein